MISLKEAFRLTDIKNTEFCYIRTKEQDRYSSNILSGKAVREKYDMKHTMVFKISPRFDFHGEYLEFIIKERK